jgi:glycosyltransferase involved in cell wall biosynthesis
MANALQSSGYQTTLHAYFEPFAQDLRSRSFELHDEVRLGRGKQTRSRLGRLANIILLCTVAAFRHFDVVYTRSPIIAICARRTKLVLLEFHEAPNAHSIKDKLNLRLVSTMRGKRYRFVFISDSLKSRFMAKFSELDSKRIIVAPSGFRQDWFPGAWSPSPGNRRVTYVGSLFQGRGVDVVIEVARIIGDADFRIFGGSMDDWAQLSAKIVIPSNCIYEPHIPPAFVPNVLIDSDVLLAPYQSRVFIASRRETSEVMSPLKIVEYLAAGRAIVASDLPAIREVLTDQMNAILLPSRDIEAWVFTLRRLLDDQYLRDDLGQRGFETAHYRLDWNARLASILDHDVMTDDA